MTDRKQLGEQPQADPVTSAEFDDQRGDVEHRRDAENAPGGDVNGGDMAFPRGSEKRRYPDPPSDLDRRVDHQEGIGSRGYELEKDHGHDRARNLNRGDYAHSDPASPADGDSPGKA